MLQSPGKTADVDTVFFFCWGVGGINAHLLNVDFFFWGGGGL